MTTILGVNIGHADTAAALVVDGELVFAIAEERLTRKKHYGGFPALAIRACLDAANVRMEELDYLAIGRNSSANRVRKVCYALSDPLRLPSLFGVWRRRKGLDDLKAMLAREMDVAPDQMRFQEVHVEHHLAHIASAFYVSGFDRCAGFSYDGAGDFVSAMFARCSGNDIEVLHRTYLPASLGHFYTICCKFLGYHKYGDEGKVMGLAPYGEDTYGEFFRRVLRCNGLRMRMDPEFFPPIGPDHGFFIDGEGAPQMSVHFSDRWRREFGEAREPYAEVGQRDKDIAFGMQKRFEECALGGLNELHRLVPGEKLAMAGGCALNSVLNGKIFDKTPFANTYIQPGAGDEGLAIGAAFYVWHKWLGKPRRFEMTHAYWGPEFSESDIRSALDAAGLKYDRMERAALLDAAAKSIARGDVVGWFQGRMEWGPRALGNRSILAHPGRADMKDILNSRVKRREWFRPFAPSILADRQSGYYEHDHPSPFMLHVFATAKDKRAALCAVNHVDDTGRIQSVTRGENELYYDLIRAFEKETGLPVVLNTSFNENEPIVCRPDEAIDCFVRTKMDTLAIGPFFVTKEKDPG
ncbi:MAG: carbamoyltransferase [Planctomycetes bacterium]|nr:carbamoyltransferase [Planctomycetota bacterium]